MNKFKIYANKISTGEGEKDYVMDHTVIVFLMS